MRAGTIVAVALGLLVLGRWAHDKPAFNLQTVAGGGFVIIVVTMLDGGRTEKIAKGIAWIILATVALGAESPLTGIARLAGEKTTGKIPPGKPAGGPHG